MLPSWVLLVLGLVLLVVGAEILVRGASRLAAAAGLSPLVIGLVVVSLGTSAPEAAVTVGAAWQGNADLAVGNVVGSNVFNILAILGLSALVVPLAVGRRLVKLDIPLMLLTSLILVLLAWDERLSRSEGLLLLVLALGYTALNVRLGRSEASKNRAAGADGSLAGATGTTTRPGPRTLAWSAVLTLVGIGVLVVGARSTVDGATTIARTLGMSELVIGLTVVAAGTSLPEVATSLLAAVRGERDIAVGNVVGSCILNILLILGLAGTIAGDGLSVAQGVRTFDLPVMLVASLAVLPIAFTGQVIARWEGALFLAYYLAYVAHLVLAATAHPVTDELALAIAWFVVPLTVLVVVVAVVQEIRRRTAAG